MRPGGGTGRHLVVFARAPRLGAVKRRLARDIGAVEALSFYRASLARLLRRVGRDGRWRTWLAVTPDASAEVGRWPEAERLGIALLAQGGGDIGDRMGRAFSSLPPGAVVIVGSDVPAVDAGHVGAAFDALHGHDVAFGPALDGGYWLVGARGASRRPGLFDNVRWSSEHALADTLANLPAHARQARLETLEDVDDGPAFRRWRRHQR
ncbi:MAG: TIGR04282 family arsenosugar biosynthesis glycosyltransferase [Alphaproteobacteria bacterium]